MRKAIFGALGLGVCLYGCSGTSSSKKLYVPEDLPDICQELDFDSNESLREVCGVKFRKYMAYRNVPQHRNLLLPKGAKIVKKGELLELRLEKTIPIKLPDTMLGKLGFEEKERRTIIKTSMDYCEFFPKDSTHRIKILRLNIPLESGELQSLCYTVEAEPQTAQRKTGHASSLKMLACEDFQRLKAMLSQR